MTIRDVAREAGVSKSTAARALSGDPRTKSSTAENVRRAAERLGYCPDPALSTIAAMRWRGRRNNRGIVLAFITCQDSPFLTSGPKASRVFLGAKAQAEALGYSLEHFDLRSYPDGESLGRILHNRGITGIILGQIMKSDPPLNLPWERFCCVAAGTGLLKHPFDTVDSDVFTGTLRVLEEVCRLGRRRIGICLMHGGTSERDIRRLGAALSFQQMSVRREDRVPVLDHDGLEEKIFLQWFQKHRPDTVISLNNITYWWLMKNKIAVPGDTAYACLELMEAEPGIAHLSYPARRIGEMAASLLDMQLRENIRGIPVERHVLRITPTWVPAESIGAGVGKVSKSSGVPALK